MSQKVRIKLKSFDHSLVDQSAEKIVEEHIHIFLFGIVFKEKEKIIMVGGSGLYIDAICKGFDKMPDISKEISKNTNFFLFLYGDPSQGFESFLRPKKLVYYNSLFDQAYNEVKEDKKYSNRVKKARLSIDYASLEAHRKNFSEKFPLTIIDNGIKVIPEIVLNRIKRFKNVTQNNNITLMNEMGFTVDEYIFYYKKALKLAVKENSAKSKKVNLLTKATKYANEELGWKAELSLDNALLSAWKWQKTLD